MVGATDPVKYSKPAELQGCGLETIEELSGII
jgi:hypothetical protein